MGINSSFKNALAFTLTKYISLIPFDFIVDIVNGDIFGFFLVYDVLDFLNVLIDV